MGYYDEFPSTNFYKQDLGWLIKAYKELKDNYEVLVQIYEIIQKEIVDITLEQLQKWLDDGTLEELINVTLLNKKIQFYTTTSSLINEVEHIDNMCVSTLGYNAINDGGGGDFLITSRLPTTPYIKLNNGLYAMFLEKEKYTLLAFGMLEDTDITDRFNEIVKWTSSLEIDLYVTLNYKVNLTKGLVLPSNTTLIGDRIHKLYGDTPYNLTHYNILYISNVHDVTVKNVVIDGVKEGNQSTTGEWGHCISIQDSLDITINGCELFNAWGDGIELGAHQVYTVEPTVEICNCYIHDCRRQGISILSCERAYIHDCKIVNINGTPPSAGIDIEPYFSEQKVGVVIIENLVINDCAEGIMIFSIGVAEHYMQTNISIKNIDITGPKSITGIDIKKINKNIKANITVENVTCKDIYGSALILVDNSRKCLNLSVKNMQIYDCGYLYEDLNEGKPVVCLTTESGLIFGDLHGGYHLENINIYFSSGITVPSRCITFYTTVADTNFIWTDVYLKTNTNNIYGHTNMAYSKIDCPVLETDEVNFVYPLDRYYSRVYLTNANPVVTVHQPPLNFSKGCLEYMYVFRNNASKATFNTPHFMPRTNQIGSNGMTCQNAYGANVTMRWDGNFWEILNIVGDWVSK